MWNVNLLAATRTVEATMPYMLYRLAVCLGLAFACLLAALVGAGTFIAFASFSANPGSVASVGALVGLGGLAYFLYRFRASLFFNVKAGHLALLAELARGEKLPQGKPLIDLAKQKAAECFPKPGEFFELNAAAGAVLEDLPPHRCPYLAKITQPPIAALFGKVAGKLARTGDQALLSLCFVAQEANPWESVRAGLVLHLRHYDMLTKNRLSLLVFELAGLVAACFAMLYPVESAASMLPVDVGVWRYVFALIFAWSLKAAFLEPIATTALADLYFDLAKRETGIGDAEIGELAANSPAFRQFTDKAG